MPQDATLALTKELISRQSVTPEDGGCQRLIAERLAAVGFACQQLKFGEVDNLWAVYGESGPLFCFAGHTDVVPPGPESEWDSPPFAPVERGEYLYGRGAADMKGSLAAMVVAAETFVRSNPDPNLRIAFLVTSDEEGIAQDGTRRVMQWLDNQNEQIRWCLVGEPSSSEKLGDVIKVGRRGSLNGKLVVQGQQGHIAYPQLAENPVHRALPALTELVQTSWDAGNEFFPATSLQISNLRSGTGATNVIPGQFEVVFNFRYSSETSAEQLMKGVETILQRHQLTYHIDWQLSGEPFLTEPGELTAAVTSALTSVLGYKAKFSTAGGTSDGRFIAPSGAEVVELGPINASIHKVNEHVRIPDLGALARVYQELLAQLSSVAAQ